MLKNRLGCNTVFGFIDGVVFGLIKTKEPNEGTLGSSVHPRHI